MLYLVLVSIIMLHWLTAPITPATLGPAYWILMGATAITVLAGAHILTLPAGPGGPTGDRVNWWKGSPSSSGHSAPGGSRCSSCSASGGTSGASGRSPTRPSLWSCGFPSRHVQRGHVVVWESGQSRFHGAVRPVHALGGRRRLGRCVRWPWWSGPRGVRANRRRRRRG